jgi:hypothetical protein
VVTLIYPDADACADEEVRIPAGGTIMPLDWEAVARAFEGANEELGWHADIEIRPERRHAWVLFPRELRDRVSTWAFYDALAARMGWDEFMSVWIDFAMKPKVA